MATGTLILLIILNAKKLSVLTKTHTAIEQIQTQDLYKCCLQEPCFRGRETHKLKVRGLKKIFHANGDQKKAGADKIDFEIKAL